MPTITVKSKPFTGIARAFFSLLHDVSSGSTAAVTVEQLLKSMPVIQYENASQRQELEDRGEITRIEADSVLTNVSDLFDLEVGFIQSGFPPDGHDELIKVRIPRELKARYEGVGTNTFVLAFDVAGTQQPYIRFPNNPDIVDQPITRVTYNGTSCTIELGELTIVADYTQEPDSENVASRSGVPEGFVKIATFVNPATDETFAAIEGYYQIKKAFRVQQDCPDDNTWCDSEMCNIEVSYEEAYITQNSGESRQEAIDRACQQKAAEVRGSHPTPDEVQVNFTNSEGNSYTQVSAPSSVAGCLGYGSDSVTDGTVDECFVVTATFGESAVLDGYYEFRDEILMKHQLGRAFVWTYYLVGPFLARICHKSKLFKQLSRALLNVVYVSIVLPLVSRNKL